MKTKLYQLRTSEIMNILTQKNIGFVSYRYQLYDQWLHVSNSSPVEGMSMCTHVCALLLRLPQIMKRKLPMNCAKNMLRNKRLVKKDEKNQKKQNQKLITSRSLCKGSFMVLSIISDIKLYNNLNIHITLTSYLCPFLGIYQCTFKYQFNEILPDHLKANLK